MRRLSVCQWCLSCVHWKRINKQILVSCPRMWNRGVRQIVVMRNPFHVVSERKLDCMSLDRWIASRRVSVSLRLGQTFDVAEVRGSKRIDEEADDMSASRALECIDEQFVEMQCQKECQDRSSMQMSIRIIETGLCQCFRSSRASVRIPPLAQMSCRVGAWHGIRVRQRLSMDVLRRYNSPLTMSFLLLWIVQLRRWHVTQSQTDAQNQKKKWSNIRGAPLWQK